MKYVKFLSMVMASMTACIVSSCYESSFESIPLDENLNKTSSVVSVAIDSNYVKISDQYSYTIKASSSANIYVNGAKKTLGVSFSSKEKEGTLLTIKAVSASTGETIEKSVLLDSNGKIITIDFTMTASAGTGTLVEKAAATAAEEGSVTITNAKAKNQTKQYSAATTASLTLTKSALDKAVAGSLKSTDTLSIYVVNPTSTATKQNLSDIVEDFPVMTVKTGSTAANFGSESANVKIESANFEENMTFFCEELGDNSEVTLSDGGVYEFSTSKLTDFTIKTKVKVELVKTDTLKSELYFVVPLGNNKLTYATKAGYECTYQSNEFINSYLDAKFGAFREDATRDVTIVNQDQKARVPYTLKQVMYTYNVYFGEVRVVVNVYGADYITVHSSQATKYNSTTNY